MKKRFFKLMGLGLALALGTSASAQCLNTNGDMETFTGPIVTSPNTASNAWINNDLDNWYSSHGTPTTLSAAPTTCMWMWSYNGIGEGIYTEYNFVAGETYEICYDLWRDGTSNPASEFRVALANGLTPNYSGTFGTAPATPTSSQSLTTQSWTGTGTWVTITETFTATSNFSQLWFYPFLAGAPTPWQAACRLDNVCVKETRVDPCDFEPMFEVTYEEECTVTLTNTTVVPSGLTILETTWDFGDGTTGKGSTVNHYYTSGGIYTVCMTVWMINEDGECCQLRVCREIEAPECDPCEWIERIEIGVTGSNPFTFTASGLPSGMYSVLGYHWNFGDGNTATGQTVTHGYAAAGAYTVCLTVYYYDERAGACCSATICIGVEAREGVRGRAPIVTDNFQEGTNMEAASQEEIQQAHDVILSPNPSNGIFDLSVPEGMVNSINVYDYSGKVVFTEQNLQQNRVQMDLSHLDKGSYLIVVNESDDMNRRFSQIVLK